MALQPCKWQGPTLNVSRVSGLASVWRYALLISISLRRPFSVKFSCTPAGTPSVRDLQRCPPVNKAAPAPIRIPRAAAP